MANEVAIYRRLTGVQGDAVPRLYGHGLLEIQGTTRAVLIEEYIRDHLGLACAEETRAAQLSLPVRRGAIDVLVDKIHTHGVAHGDPRMANVIFEAVDVPGLVHDAMTDSSPMLSPIKARFVDLAFAEVNPDKETLDEDLQGWGRTLSLPEFE
ncbi:hypothetical protein GGF43_007004 [Coemansia sp. RSA 2618]|nr:hypothetical protein GGF43_007004 [Coemansia sp. RSA 2618]